ncbi:hypothetical protein F4820DRAFT_445996 [Hypoxylon rubiginosum]|uniref:Uncharacterized protein n=1 Tax=Hypoxylon rubiginosum TaxID=110542 RepID=A0ACB9Z7V5_9PEZI|nr:hypothetical protein F4820DRAFT_445996 [Hypoxylon rubiginosum]
MGRSVGVGGDKQHSLMHVSEFTEDHPYWGTLRQSQILNTKPTTGDANNDIRLYEDHAHIQTTANHKPPTQKLDHGGQKLGGRRRKGMSIAGRNQGRAREKRFGLADPVVWDAINRSLVQQRRLTSLIVPEVTATQAIPDLEVPSRTSSQRKALNRFTRQLEKYANVAGAAGNVPVMTPTESESRVSYHTVQPLLPFRREFQAAGLAVTSAEQGRKSPIDDPACVDHSPENSKELMESNGEFDGQEDLASEQRSSTSGSFIEFTPDGGLIEPLSPPKSKSKQKSTHKVKRGILPWLKKEPMVSETHGTEFESQERWQPIKDGRVQSEMRAIGSRNPRGHHITYTHQDLPARVVYPSTPTTRHPKLPSAPDINTPQKPPYVRSGPTKAQQADRGRRSEPIISYTDSGLGTRQPVFTGLRKRDIAVARLPRPETIAEEQETSPNHTHQTISQENPRPESKVVPVPASEIKPPSQNLSSQTTPSSVPSLPYPARYASGRPSSLERALDEVSQQLDKMEQEADKTAMFSRPPTLVEKTNQKKQQDSPVHSGQHASKTVFSRRPHMLEEFVYVDRKMPTVSPCEPKPKPKAVQPPARSPPRPPPKPTRAAPTPAPTQSQSLPSPPKEKVLPKTPRTKDVMNEVDVFIDYEDGDINDRDVIKGLQVAIRAAADDRYDAMIRDKTGLRIRRFLADLRAVGEMPHEKSGH